MILEMIEEVGIIIDAVGVGVMVLGLLWGLLLAGKDLVSGKNQKLIYSQTRHRFGRSIVIGLEILVASDIIHTVGVEPTLQNATVLAILILVRTFINWTLILDLEERWPWQKNADEPSGSAVEVAA